MLCDSVESSDLCTHFSGILHPCSHGVWVSVCGGASSRLSGEHLREKEQHNPLFDQYYFGELRNESDWVERVSSPYCRTAFSNGDSGQER